MIWKKRHCSVSSQALLAAQSFSSLLWLFLFIRNGFVRCNLLPVWAVFSCQALAAFCCLYQQSVLDSRRWQEDLEVEVCWIPSVVLPVPRGLLERLSVWCTVWGGQLGTLCQQLTGGLLVTTLELLCWGRRKVGVMLIPCEHSPLGYCQPADGLDCFLFWCWVLFVCLGEKAVEGSWRNCVFSLST